LPRASRSSKKPSDLRLPSRPAGAHKGRFGHVLIVAGSRGMTGAAVLCARAALRAGCGLATVAVPESQQPAVAAQLVEAMTFALPETEAGTLRAEAAGRLQALNKERDFRVLAMGPGLGSHPEVARAVVGILGTLVMPAVLDADALNQLALQPTEELSRLLSRRGAPCVLTPHPGEMARLSRRSIAEIEADREAACSRLARELGAVCLLKGPRTVISDGKTSRVNSTGNAGLAKGGTGDVLTGVIAGLWSQFLADDPGDNGFSAAALGARLHGLAADIAARDKTTRALVASDVIEALPAAFRALA